MRAGPLRHRVIFERPVVVRDSYGQETTVWTEAVTLLAESHVPDDVYEQARTQFSEAELVDRTIAVTTINSWNRLAVSFRQSPSA